MDFTEQTLKEMLKAKTLQKIENMFIETASTLLKGEEDKEAHDPHTQEFIKIPKDQDSKPLDKKTPEDSTPMDCEPCTMHIESQQSLENLAAQIKSLKFLRKTAADKGDSSAAEVFDNQIAEIRAKRNEMMSESAKEQPQTYHKVTMKHPETNKETVLKVFHADTKDHAHMAAKDHMPKHIVTKVEHITEDQKEMQTNQKDSEVKKNINRFLNKKECDEPLDNKEPSDEVKMSESQRMGLDNPYILGNKHADNQHPHSAALDRKTADTSVDPADQMLDAAGKAVEAGGKAFADKNETDGPSSDAKANVTSNLKIRNASEPPKKKVTEATWMVNNTHVHKDKDSKDESPHQEVFDKKEPNTADASQVKKDVIDDLEKEGAEVKKIKVVKESDEDQDRVRIHDPLDMMRKHLHGKEGRIMHKSSGFGNHVHIVQVGDKEHAIDRSWLRPVNESLDEEVIHRKPKKGQEYHVNKHEDELHISKIGSGEMYNVHHVPNTVGAAVKRVTIHGRDNLDKHIKDFKNSSTAMGSLHHESLDESATHYHSIFVKNKDNKEWNHHFDADNKSDAADEARSQRNTGYKVKTLRVPKDQADWRKPEHLAAARAKLNEESEVPSLSKLQNEYRRGRASLNDLNEALSVNSVEAVEKHMQWRETNLAEEDMIYENSVMKMAGKAVDKVKKALSSDDKIHTQEYIHPDTGSSVVMHTLKRGNNVHRIFHLAPTKHAHYTKNGHFMKPDETHKEMKKHLNKDYLDESLEAYLDEHITKEGSKYVLRSKKSGKHLGTFDSEAQAKKREQQIEYFKHQNESLNEAASSKNMYKSDHTSITYKDPNHKVQFGKVVNPDDVKETHEYTAYNHEGKDAIHSVMVNKKTGEKTYHKNGNQLTMEKNKIHQAIEKHFEV